MRKDADMRAGGLELKFCEAGADLTVSDGMKIEGYASVFDLRDEGGDLVAKGAYQRCLDDMSTTGRRVKMLWQHDPREPIGRWEEISEDSRGLFVRGRLLNDVARAREAAALIKAGAIEGLSIGYRARKSTAGRDGKRILRDIDLWEISLVTFPMLAEARVDPSKKDAQGATERAVAAVLCAKASLRDLSR